MITVIIQNDSSSREITHAVEVKCDFSDPSSSS